MFNHKFKSEKYILIGLILVGVLSSVYFYNWWFEEGKIFHPVGLLVFILAVFYSIPQIYFYWYILLHIRLPRHKDNSKKNYTVDVFLPTYNEPLWLIEDTLKAVVDMKYPHRTYLIDDGRKRDHKELAEKYNAIYITRNDNKHNKAGNINNALEHSFGEIVAIFDIDHIPDENYLERGISHFDNADIGVVQILLDHSNSNESFVARACSELNDDFFGPSTLGMNGCGCTTVFGSNSIFRRKALESIGGYQTGLAEDLNTSITLHAQGWKSEYIPESLAKGLVPADIISFFKQQLKWSRGVFDTLFNLYPKLAGKLNVNKTICYLTRMTYYVLGPVISVHILATIISLLNIVPSFTAYFADYLYHALPFFITFVFIHQYSGKNFRLKETEPGLHFRGPLLVFGTWPIYTFSFICAIFKVKVPFIPTPKELRGRKFIKRIFKLVYPQILVCSFILIGLIGDIVFTTHTPYIIIVFGVIILLLHLGLFYSIMEDYKRVMSKEVITPSVINHIEENLQFHKEMNML